MLGMLGLHHERYLPTPKQWMILGVIHNPYIMGVEHSTPTRVPQSDCLLKIIPTIALVQFQVLTQHGTGSKKYKAKEGRNIQVSSAKVADLTLLGAPTSCYTKQK